MTGTLLGLSRSGFFYQGVISSYYCHCLGVPTGGMDAVQPIVHDSFKVSSISFRELHFRKKPWTVIS